MEFPTECLNSLAGLDALTMLQQLTNSSSQEFHTLPGSHRWRNPA